MTGRRSDSLPRRFARLYTAAITDVMDEMGLQRQTLPSDIQPLAPAMRTAGYAFTARGRRHRGRARDRDQTLRRFLGMISAVPADSVLVLAANDSAAAHFGELSAEWFRTHRVRGAVIDGATWMQTLTKVFMPVALPGLIAATIFAFTVSWAQFLYPLAFTTSIDQLVLPVGIVTSLVKADVYNWGQIMAGALLGAAPPLIIYAFLMDYYIAGLTAGATKG